MQLEELNLSQDLNFSNFLSKWKEEFAIDENIAPLEVQEKVRIP